MYFDTDDFALREHGVSLRARKAGGQRLQTIKTNSSALITGEEWETEIDCGPRHCTCAAPNHQADGTAEARLRNVRGAPGHSIAFIGDSDIELAFDQGRVATVDAKLELAEIEIELKHGDRSEVARLAKKLARTVPVTLSVRAKAELGYALLDGTLDAPVFAERS